MAPPCMANGVHQQFGTPVFRPDWTQYIFLVIFRPILASVLINMQLQCTHSCTTMRASEAAWHHKVAALQSHIMLHARYMLNCMVE